MYNKELLNQCKSRAKLNTNLYNNYVPELGEIICDKDKMEKHLSFIKIGDGKHRYEDLPYEHLPIPDNLSGIKTYTNTGTGSISFTDFHDNIFVYQFDKAMRLIKYSENDDYIETREYDEYKMISRISNLCDENMI